MCTRCSRLQSYVCGTGCRQDPPAPCLWAVRLGAWGCAHLFWLLSSSWLSRFLGTDGSGESHLRTSAPASWYVVTWHHFNTENNTHRNVWPLCIYLIFLTTLPICFLCLWCCFLTHTHLKLLCLTAGLTLIIMFCLFYSLVHSFVLKFIFSDTSVITPALFH